MSRRVKRPLAKKSERDAGKRRVAFKGAVKRTVGNSVLEKPLRAPAPLRAKAPVEAPTVVTPPLPTKVQTVTVTADEANMRVDRFLEHRFPGLSFSHI